VVLERSLSFAVQQWMVGNTHRPWTAEDDRRLLELRAAGRSAVSISAALKRSGGAVISRLSILRARAKSSMLRDETERTKRNGPSAV